MPYLHAYLHAFKTGHCFASIHAAAVVVVAVSIGSGAGHVTYCGDTPTHSPVVHVAAVIK